jgi:hypothetical protein
MAPIISLRLPTPRFLHGRSGRQVIGAPQGAIFSGIRGARVSGTRKPRNRIAALDATTGAATSWDPDLAGGNEVRAIAASGPIVYVGGVFTSIGGQPQSNLAAASSATTDVEVTEGQCPLALASPYPNPSRSSALIRFTLPAEGVATLAIYDVLGSVGSGKSGT